MPVHRALLTTVLAAVALAAPAPGSIVQFVFTSDAHYGLTRPAFRGHTDVGAAVVNAALVAKINALPGAVLPKDGGVRAGEPVGAVDFVVEGGDIASTMEVDSSGTVQPASVSWAQFKAAYIDGLTVTNPAGRPAALFILPGNMDASNAWGYHKPMSPAIDKTSMVEIYNRMMSPAQPKSSATYDFATDKVRFSRDIGGLHFMFLTLWPDSATRAWMETDLAAVSRSTPVIVFAHDPPDGEPKHFINPNGRHDINPTDRFDNLLSDQFADRRAPTGNATMEQRALEIFLARHPNVTAYFHGHTNWNQFYDWRGPGRGVLLHTFRVDSPIKGQVSSEHESRLSFQLATIDTATRVLTVREVLWNADPAHPDAAVVWGARATVRLAPRP